MRLAAAVLLVALPLLATPALAQPGSGALWELGMSIEGMEGMEGMGGFQMPKQRMCMPKDSSEPPPAEEECKILEQKSQGNRHWMKAQCKEGLVEIDQTRTSTTLVQTLKMTDTSGETTEMRQTGKLLGDCDYNAERRKQDAEIAAIQKQADDSRRQGAAEMAKLCAQAAVRMDATTLWEPAYQCSDAQKKQYCNGLQTPGGYGKAAANARMMAQAGKDDFGTLARSRCGLDAEQLRVRHCRTAVQENALGFVNGNCPAERSALIAQHCAGRSYSSQIAPAFRDFCAGSMNEEQGSEGAIPPGDDSASRVEQPPADPANKATEGVKKGVQGLKKVFGL